MQHRAAHQAASEHTTFPLCQQQPQTMKNKYRQLSTRAPPEHTSLLNENLPALKSHADAASESCTYFRSFKHFTFFYKKARINVEENSFYLFRPHCIDGPIKLCRARVWRSSRLFVVSCSSPKLCGACTWSRRDFLLPVVVFGIAEMTAALFPTLIKCARTPRANNTNRTQHNTTNTPPEHNQRTYALNAHYYELSNFKGC